MRFVYKNHLSELETLAKDVASFGKSHQLDADFLFALNLCLDEILTNIISYAFDDAEAHDIVVEFERQDRAIIVVISDQGKPFNPLTAIQPPDAKAKLEHRKVGGLGMFFVKTMTDHVAYERVQNTNRLKLVKMIPRKVSALNIHAIS